MQKLPVELIHARTCYKHLAGELGVAITTRLLQLGYIMDSTAQNRHCFVLTHKGWRWCERHGIDKNLRQPLLGTSRKTDHDFGKSCMDHSHCVPHLAGALGRAILSFMRENHYCQITGSRCVTVTSKGVSFLQTALGINWAQIEE